MADRFFSQFPIPADTIELRGPEAHHLATVMRKQTGDAVELFDGAGIVAQTRILSASKKRVELEIQHRSYFERPGFEFTLATAVPKGDRFKSLVEKATEIGVTRVIPLRTGRSIVHPNDGKLAKSRQTVIEACKQCRRNWLMDIDPLSSIDDLDSQTADDSLKLIADPNGPAISATAASSTKDVMCVVGPEGGLTDDELARLESQGFQRCSLGSNILRIETAGLVIASIMLHGRS